MHLDHPPFPRHKTPRFLSSAISQAGGSSDAHPRLTATRAISTPPASAAQADAPLSQVGSAAFYEQVVSLVPGIVYVFNHDTMANEYSNRSLARLLGYGSDEIIEMGDALLQAVIHPDDLDGLVAYFATLSNLADDDVAHFEYRIFARDGRVLRLRTIDAVLERNTDGTVLRHIGVASDATEQIEQRLELARLNLSLEKKIVDRTHQLAELNATLEAKVDQRTAELLAINDELEQLTYIVTHDLKVPVTNLTHLTQILNEDAGSLTADQRNILEWMEISCARANAKIIGMENVAHARSAALKPLENLHLPALARSAFALFQHEIGRLNAKVTWDFAAAEHVAYLPFDAASIFENLIGNALKYAHPDRPPEIHLRSWMQAGRVKLGIRDNGTGLCLPADEEKVFGLFKRAHVEPQGSGIALYTIKKLLERYGGQINIFSAKGEWTEFQITFPKAPLSFQDGNNLCEN